MDETLRDTCIADQFVKCLNIGLLCVQHDPSDRPTMPIIIKMLDGETVNLPTPKQPAFSIRRDQSSSTSSSRPESNNELTNSLEGRWWMVTVLMNLVILFIKQILLILLLDTSSDYKSFPMFVAVVFWIWMDKIWNVLNCGWTIAILKNFLYVLEDVN